ncbi:hypothetical protein ACFFRR_006855 [Megaselia abdita]
MSSNIVITGMSGRFPNSHNVDELEYNLYNKVDMIDDDERRWRHTSPETVKRSGKIYDLEKFDATFFGINKKLATCMDPQIRVMYEVAFEAVFDSGINPRELAGSNTGVYAGMGFTEATESWLFHKSDTDAAVLGNSRFMSANWISYILDLKGPSLSVDTACSSSAYALDMAYSGIMRGEIEAAIVLGSNLQLHPYTAIQFNRLGVLSQDGRCRTFDVNASGYARSDAIVGVFVQKKENARRVYSEILFSQVNNDGYKDHGITRPSSNVQVGMLRKALEATKIHPNDVGYAETHGTGTLVGDPKETRALDSVIASSRSEPLLIGSIKSNLGHSENASGLCSLVKVLLALDKGLIAPNLNFQVPNPEIKALLEGRLKVVTEVTALTKPYITLNSFGVGGSNANFILKQNEKIKMNIATNLPALILWSGRTTESIETIFNDIEKHPLDLEHLALLHNIQKVETPSFTARGYGIFSEEDNVTKCLKSKVSVHNETTRPLVWVFGGIGSAWNQMGKDLLMIPSFRNSVEQCAEITKSLGVDLLEILTSLDPAIFENIQNQLIGITSMQICLVDLMKELNIVPDFMIGHSAGEIGCGYADGALTKEQALKTSFYRGSTDDAIEGGMAAIGLSYKEVLPLITDDIDVACHNSSTSCTISGPIKSIQNCVEELKAKGIFAKHVNSSGMAYHSRYIAFIRKGYEEFIETLIPEPKRRSEKWISTCFPKEKLHLKESQFCSAEYYGVNMVSPVLFEESSNELPRNAITVEIGPHALMMPIVKRALEKGLHFGITKRGNLEGVKYFMETIGELYTNGIYVDIRKLYPEVEFPVSRGTRGISSKIKWNHSEDWFVPDFTISSSNSGGNTVRVSLKDEKFEFLKDYVIDGSILIPTGAYLKIVWDLFSGEHEGVEFLDLKIFKNIYLSMDEDVELGVNIQSGSGNFEITKGSEIVCSGTIKPSTKQIEIEKNQVNNGPIISGDNFYTELKHRGYEFQDRFKNVSSASFNGAHGSAKWNNNWITFIESMIQLSTFGSNSRSIQVPKSINKLLMQPLKIGAQTLNINCCRTRNLISSPLLEIHGVEFSVIERQMQTNNAIHQAQMFVPLSFSQMSTLNAASVIVQLYLESNKKNSLKIFEVGGSKNCIQKFQKVVEDTPLLKATFYLQKEGNSYPGIEIVENPLDNCDILISTDCNEDQLKSLTEGGYLVLKTCQNKCNFKELVQISTICLLHDESYFVVMKKQTESLKDNQDILFVSPSENESWLRNAKDSTAKIVSLQCQDSQYIKHFQDKVLFLSNGKLPQEFCKMQLKLGLSVNVFEKAQWGTYRNLYISQNEDYSYSKDKCIYSNVSDISNFKWIESPLSKESSSIDVVYSSLSYKDSFGMEFSGIKDKKRIMGVVEQTEVASNLKTSSVRWEVPRSWTLHEAATVPLAYLTVYYAFFHRITIKKGQSIFVNSGTDGVGLAAIRVALAYGLDVYTKSYNEQTRTFLLKTIPQLKEINILTSKDENTMNYDLVFNSEPNEGLQALLRSVADGGTLLQVLNVNILLSKTNHEILRKIQDLITVDLDKDIVKPLPSITFSSKNLQKGYEFSKKEKPLGKVLIKIRDESNNYEILPVSVVPRIYFSQEKLYIVISDLEVFDIEVVDFMIHRGARRILFQTRTNITSSYLDYRISLWKTYGCEIEVSSGELSKTKCEELLKNKSIAGVIDFLKSSSSLKLLDNVSRETCSSMDFYAFNVGVNEDDDRKAIINRRIQDGLKGKYLHWACIEGINVSYGGFDPQKTSSCISDLDLLFKSPYPIVSSLVVSDKNQSTETESHTVLDSVLNILGIKDRSSVSLQNTLNSLGLDSIMTTEIKEVLEREFSLKLSPFEIRMMTVQKLYNISKSM